MASVLPGSLAIKFTPPQKASWVDYCSGQIGSRILLSVQRATITFVKVAGLFKCISLCWKCCYRSVEVPWENSSPSPQLVRCIWTPTWTWYRPDSPRRSLSKIWTVWTGRSPWWSSRSASCARNRCGPSFSRLFSLPTWQSTVLHQICSSRNGCVNCLQCLGCSCAHHKFAECPKLWTIV